MSPLSPNLPTIAAAWQRLGFYERLLTLLLLGYFVGERGFAELHLPGTPLYIGEIVLLAGIVRLLLLSRADLWLGVPPLYCLAGLILLSIFSMRRHVWQDWVSSARDAATTYYMLFTVIACTRNGRWIIIFLCRLFSRFGPLFLAVIAIQAGFPDFFTNLTPFPDHQHGILRIFSNLWPLHAMIIAMLGCAGHHSDDSTLPPAALILLIGAIALVLLTQCRGATLGGVAALIVFLTLLRSKRRWEWSLAAIAVILLLGIVATSILPGNSTDPDVQDLISAHQVTSKFVSIVANENADFKPNAVHFRTRWWIDIVDLNLSRFDLAVFGQGFGANAGAVGGRFDYAPLVRAAHNSWVNIFWWLGLSGFFLYLLFFAFILRHFYTFIRTRNPLALSYCAPLFAATIGGMIGSSFDHTFSNPVSCIPLFTLVGSALAAAHHAVSLPPHPLPHPPRPQHLANNKEPITNNQ